MTKKLFIKFIYLFLPLVIVGGCLKDSPLPPDPYVTTDTIDMLLYFESNGDIINSPGTANVFVNVQDLYSNLSNYVILDIRNPQLFTDGHINEAININSADLLTKVKSLDTANVILVSQNGQSASYFAGLLRLGGFINVYVLTFGMASWNDHFANDWKGMNGNTPTGYKYFNNVDYYRGPYTDLPEVNLNSSGNIEDKIEQRIQSLLSEKFDDGVTYSDSTSLTISSQYAFDADIYSPMDSTFGDQYIICYSARQIYYAPPYALASPGHAPHSILYIYYHDLSSNFYLQTIPTNKKVVIYSSSGHLSAFVTAYLRLLGYKNVRSLLFGATWFNPFPGSMNYPYVN